LKAYQPLFEKIQDPPGTGRCWWNSRERVLKSDDSDWSCRSLTGAGRPGGFQIIMKRIASPNFFRNVTTIDEVDDNKPIEVDTPRVKRAIGDLPTLKKKLRTSPSSLSSDLKREQMLKYYKYQIMQFGIEERKLELLEQESTIKMETLKAEAAREHLNVER